MTPKPDVVTTTWRRYCQAVATYSGKRTPANLAALARARAAYLAACDLHPERTPK